MRLSGTYALFKAELKAQVVSPTFYIFLIIFLVLHGFLTLRIGGFFDGSEASMAGAFFWHPWLYLVLIPAIGMHLWADERRDGTLELLFTHPVTVTEAVLGKFLAASTVIVLALIGTLPMVGTICYLGEPDWGPLICGYIGSFLLGETLLSLTCLTSALTRSHVISFILAFVGGMLLNLLGFIPVLNALKRLDASPKTIEVIASFSTVTHFESMQRGVLELQDGIYFLGIIALFLILNAFVLETKRNG